MNLLRRIGRFLLEILEELDKALDYSKEGLSAIDGRVKPDRQ